jgi:dUTP pyrophosphatase
LDLKIKLEKNARLPVRAHASDAGYDLFATRNIYIMPHGKVTADTGVHCEIPAGYFGDIRPKSGLLFNHDIFTAGTVDAGYTGTVRVRIINLGSDPYEFHEGDKIAQMVLVPCLTPALEVVEELEETERGEGGFGSTGR